MFTHAFVHLFEADVIASAFFQSGQSIQSLLNKKNSKLLLENKLSFTLKF